jgi:hypothetical protein
MRSAGVAAFACARRWVSAKAWRTAVERRTGSGTRMMPSPSSPARTSSSSSAVIGSSGSFHVRDSPAAARPHARGQGQLRLGGAVAGYGILAVRSAFAAPDLSGPGLHRLEPGIQPEDPALLRQLVQETKLHVAAQVRPAQHVPERPVRPVVGGAAEEFQQEAAAPALRQVASGSGPWLAPAATTARYARRVSFDGPGSMAHHQPPCVSLGVCDPRWPVVCSRSSRRWVRVCRRTTTTTPGLRPARPG